MSQRVLHVVTSLDPDAGSLGVVFAGLVRTLTAHDWISTIAVLDGTCRAGPACQVVAGNRASAAALVQDCDLLHIHGYTEPDAEAFAKAARRQGTPYVLAPHGRFSVEAPAARNVVRRYFDNRAAGAMLESAAVVQVLHEVEADELGATAPGTSATILPYGIDSGEFAPAATADATDEAHQYMLLLGPIEPTEGALVLLKALAEVGSVADGWHVVIAGPNRGDYRVMLEAGIHRKGAEDRVRFAPAADAAGQVRHLAAVSLVVAAGLRIRPPVSIMQAVAMGVPVLATDYVAPDELKEHLFVCRPNRADLRTRLREVLELNADERNTRAAAAAECLRTRLDWNVLGGRYADCYRKALETTRR